MCGWVLLEPRYQSDAGLQIAARSSNCMLMVFITSIECDVAKESQALFRYHVAK